MKLKEKSAIVVISLAVPNNFAAIYPKEIAEKFAPEVKATEYDRDRPLQARRVEAGPVHPHGPLRRLQVAQREAERLRRRQDRVRGRGPLASRARRRDPRGPDRDGRARLRRRPEPGRLRPAEEELESPSYRRQAVLLARRGLQQEGRPDDEPEAPPGLAGGDRHRADHEERGGRPSRVLPDGLEPGHGRDRGVAHEAHGAALERAQQGRRPSSSCRRRATRTSRSDS